jgi:hypothetical protein
MNDIEFGSNQVNYNCDPSSQKSIATALGVKDL